MKTADSNLTYNNTITETTTTTSSQTKVLRNITNQPLVYNSTFENPITFVTENDAQG